MTRQDKFIFAIIGVLVVLAFVLMLRDVYAFGVDDSYIFYRYGENLSNGHGIVFNPGEPPGEGFTSWAWLLLLALSRCIGVDIIFASKVLGIFFHLAGGVFIFWLVLKLIGGENESLAKISALILSGSFLLNYRLIAHSVSGMETSLYVFSIIGLTFLTTLALQALPTDKKWWLFISLAAAGAFLVRPEGIAAGGISLLALALHQRHNLLKPKTWLYVFIGLVLPLSLFIAWKIMVFGYPLPHSYYHKLIVISEEYEESLRQMLLFFESYWWLMVLAVSTMIYMYPSLESKIILPYYYPALFLAMVAVYLLFYPAMNYLHRFYIPYLPLLLVMIAPGIYMLVRKTLFKKVGIRALLIFLILAVLVMGMNFQMKTPRFKIKGWAELVNPYTGVSRAKLGVLMSRLPSDVVAANTEMGVIPFYSGLACIDMAGLTDPHTAHNGVSMDYLHKRNVQVILFPRDVEAISKKNWNLYTHPYGCVFLSKMFIENFKFVGWYANYYLYADKQSSRFNLIEAWGKKYLGPRPLKSKAR
jgi:arabinofuranosyltransferase